jgi:hypothetical protein
MIYGIPHARPIDRYGRNCALFSSENLEWLAHHRLLCRARSSFESREESGASFLAFSSSSWTFAIVAEGPISFAYRLSKTDLLRLSDEVESFLSGELPHQKLWQQTCRAAPYFPLSDYTTTSTCEVDCLGLARCDGRVPLPLTQAHRPVLPPGSKPNLAASGAGILSPVNR